MGKERVKSRFWRLQKETGNEILEREIIRNGGWERGRVKSRTRNCKERQERRFMKDEREVIGNGGCERGRVTSMWEHSVRRTGLSVSNQILTSYN